MSSGALPPAGLASGLTQSPEPRVVDDAVRAAVSNSRSTYFFMPS